MERLKRFFVLLLALALTPLANARQITGYTRTGEKITCPARQVSQGMKIEYKNGMRRCHNLHYVVLTCENGRQICSQRMNHKHPSKNK